jgi:hypothetical protein
MKELVFFLEERSAQAFLESFLPRILDSRVTLRFISFDGKQDLEKQLVKRLRGYINQRARFIVLRDQDSFPDCRVLKSRLMRLCQRAGKARVSLVRIACTELESFYIGDFAAVERATGVGGLVGLESRRRFRAPDQIMSPSRLLNDLLDGRYSKIRDSREIGKHVEESINRSVSFGALCEGVRRFERELLSIN